VPARRGHHAGSETGLSGPLPGGHAAQAAPGGKGELFPLCPHGAAHDPQPSPRQGHGPVRLEGDDRRLRPGPGPRLYGPGPGHGPLYRLRHVGNLPHPHHRPPPQRPGGCPGGGAGGVPGQDRPHPAPGGFAPDRPQHGRTAPGRPDHGGSGGALPLAHPGLPPRSGSLGGIVGGGLPAHRRHRFHGRPGLAANHGPDQGRDQNRRGMDLLPPTGRHRGPAPGGP